MERRSSKAAALAATLSVFCFASTLPAAAQQDQLPDRTSFHGVVVDDATGAPLPAVEVILIERARPTFSDLEGRFSFDEVRPGTLTLIVTDLGYDSLRIDVEHSGPDDPVVVRMTPDPIVLERIAVMKDGLERRRRRMGPSGRVFDRLTLQTTSASSVMDLVQTNSGLLPASCPRQPAMTACAYVRGRLLPVRVFVDEAAILAGIDALFSLRPEELYALEVIDGGRVIRAYTNWFMKTVADGRRQPPNL